MLKVKEIEIPTNLRKLSIISHSNYKFIKKNVIYHSEKCFLMLTDDFPTLTVGFLMLTDDFPTLPDGFPTLTLGFPMLTDDFPTLPDDFPTLTVGYMM